jgi:hypothetical protein
METNVLYCNVLCCIIFINKATAHTLGKTSLGIFFNFRLPDCWLVVSMHPEGPATGHLDTVSWFSSVFKQMPRWFPNSKFLLHASHVDLTILNS